MRSIKGYCMRQARREVYRAIDKNRRHTYVQQKKEKEEFTNSEVYIGLAWIIGFILFINIMCHI
jgi:hypothetical protein